VEPAGERLETDVLVLGGGVAGCIAALQARAAGADAVLVDKALSIKRSGDTGHGAAFLTCFLELGEDWDTADPFVRWAVDLCDGLIDEQVFRKIGAERVPEVCRYVEGLGIPLRFPEASELRRVKLVWQAAPYSLMLPGSEIKPVLERHVRESGTRLLTGVHLTRILTSADGRAAGATGIGVRDGSFKVITAKTIVLALGSSERVIHTASRDPFNTYHRPWHGATGYVLATDAGAEIENIEFLGTFLFPKGFAAGAMSNLLEAGGKLVNGRGEVITELPAETGERLHGWGLPGRATREILAGRGPVFIDCTQVSDAKLADLMTYIGYDAPLFVEFLQQSGLDLRKDPVEFQSFFSTWNATGSPKGLVIDGECQTRVPGLFVAGDLAAPSYSLMGAYSTGWISGRSSAVLARSAGPAEPAPGVVEAERERVFKPLGRRRGLRWREFENRLRDTMTEYVGISRTESGLARAGDYLSQSRAAVGDLEASGPHELMRTLEAIDLLSFDELMTRAARERTETRFAYLVGHYRADFPETNDAEWRGKVVRLRRTATGIESSLLRLNSPVSQA
jgi:succinate dehydrogenase/fumarate reductase flavoprotein subunit